MRSHAPLAAKPRLKGGDNLTGRARARARHRVVIVVVLRRRVYSVCPIRRVARIMPLHIYARDVLCAVLYIYTGCPTFTALRSFNEGEYPPPVNFGVDPPSAEIPPGKSDRYPRRFAIV